MSKSPTKPSKASTTVASNGGAGGGHATNPPHVYTAIQGISHEFAEQGLAKGDINKQQNFKFRGIDAVMNALAPMLVRHNLIIIPRMVARDGDARMTKSGTALYVAVVAAEFDFISAVDGSTVTARTYGEAMDTADKATNKAMAVAYKYAAFQTFCIPTEGGGDIDADAITHEDSRPVPSTRTRDEAQEEPSEEQEDDELDGEEEDQRPLSKAEQRALYSELEEGLRACKTMRGLQTYWSETVSPERHALGKSWYQKLSEEKDACKHALEAKAKSRERVL